MTLRLADTMQQTATTPGVSSYLDSIAKQQEVSPIERILDKNLSASSHRDRGSLQDKENKIQRHTWARSGGPQCLPHLASQWLLWRALK